MTRHIHILGICGTFMGGLALLAREMGLEVSGSDAAVYPPMSTQLEAAGIELREGYLPEHLQPAPDLVVVGNALGRGNPAVEYLLDSSIPYTSGPGWLAEQVLRGRRVLAVAGTHGKTSTSSMLAWILEHAGHAPGFLIGGVPGNFGQSARLGGGECFVVEADEYDTAFFDKRSKFIHYRPRTLCLNNLEFDHADIFADLEAIKTQFHHLLRTVPPSGRVIWRKDDAALEDVLARGCWSEAVTFSVNAKNDDAKFGNAKSADWRAEQADAAGGRFELVGGGERAAVEWSCRGRHNLENALAAAAAAHHAGVSTGDSAAALAAFQGVRRRMELLADIGGVRVYDDFAHHPTAIAATLAGLRAEAGEGGIAVLIEPRSRSMRMGSHREALPGALREADRVYWYRPDGLDWQPSETAEGTRVYGTTTELVRDAVADSRRGDHLVIMSNGDFEGVHGEVVEQLRRR